MDEQWWVLLRTLLIVVLVCVTLGLLLLALVYRSLRRINVPPNADFWATLRVVPLVLVVALDLLDLGLDMFAAPIVWVVLSHFRLHALRNVSAIEALIPFTQPIPVLTLSWLAARIFRFGATPGVEQPYVIDIEASTSLPDRPEASTSPPDRPEASTSLPDRPREVRSGEFRPRARR